MRFPISKLLTAARNQVRINEFKTFTYISTATSVLICNRMFENIFFYKFKIEELIEVLNLREPTPILGNVLRVRMGFRIPVSVANYKKFEFITSAMILLIYIIIICSRSSLMLLLTL